MRVVGIDPGNSGGIGLLEDRAFRNVVDIPLMNKFDDNDKKELDAAKFAEVLRSMEPDVVVIEKIHVTPTYGKPSFCRGFVKTADGSGRMKQCNRIQNTMPPTAGFNMGDSFGGLKATVRVLGYELILIAPQKWKNQAKLIKADKETSRELAIRLFPEAAGHLARKKDEGRAEALLIGFYGGFAEATELPSGGKSRVKGVRRQLDLA